MNELQITYRYPGDLRDNPANAKRHPERQLAKLERSIRQFGFLAPVLIGENDTILAGHGRVAAARRLSLELVPTICAAHLSEAQCRAYSGMISDDKALVLFSGGQDSATCLAWALENFSEVETVGFDYGQRHRVELECRSELLKRIVEINPTWKVRLGTDHRLDLSVLGQISETGLTRDVEITLRADGLATVQHAHLSTTWRRPSRTGAMGSSRDVLTPRKIASSDV